VPDLSACTALAVTSVLGELTAYAARRCMGSGFADVRVLTDLKLEVPTTAIEPLAGIKDYNRFLHRRLIEHVQTPFVLIFQWDGFVLDPDAWTDEFWDYDYIGAPWAEDAAPPDRRVGNGGFSLRSRRLLEALQDPGLEFDAGRPEDKVICRELRPELEARHGIRFAPVELAERFAFEHGVPPGPAFGFHGEFNLPLAMPEADLWWALERLPERLWIQGRVWRWVARARKSGRRALADRLHRHCLEAFPERTREWPRP
jgi:hypothetical protein